MSTKKINNLDELMEELSEAFFMVKNDPRRVPQAESMSNIAGKMINGTKVTLDYQRARKEIPDIPFLRKGLPMKA